MELKEIAKDVYACLQEDRGIGWNNAGFVNLGGGLAIDTFYDLNLTRQMIGLYKTVSNEPICRLVNTHHNGDHTWGNQLFQDSEIIAHRLCAEEMEKEKKLNLPGLFQKWIQRPKALPPAIKGFIERISKFDYSGIELTLPNHLIEDKLDIKLDGYPCQLIYVGPAHTSGDLIVNLPEHKVIFAGDIVFSQCTPVGWEGTYAKWNEALDMVISLKPEVIVPGHGPLCGIEEVNELRAYFEFVYSEAKRFFDEGLDPLEASKKIDLGSYAKWTEPERLFFSVYRAYREFRNVEPWNAPINALDLFRNCYELRVHWDGS
ncbi:MAG: MBL fold metallo-hydrolase [Promethearchaeota archaeon]